MLKTDRQHNKGEQIEKVPYTGEIPNTPLRYIWYLIKNNKLAVLISVVVATLAELIVTSIPYIFRKIIDSADSSAQEIVQSDVIFWALLFPTAVLLTDLLWRASGFLGMRWMTKANARSYKVLFDYLGRHSHTYFSDRFAGSISSKVTHASDGAQSLYESFLWNYYPGVLALLFTAIYISTINLTAGFVFLGMLAILIPLNMQLAKYRRPHVVAFAEQNTKTRGYLVDSLSNISAVRQYSAQPFEAHRLLVQLNIMRQLNLRQWGISEWGLVANNIIIAISQFTLVIITLNLWTGGTISTGELIMMVTLLLNVTGTLVFIGSSMNSFIRKFADIEEGLTDILQPHNILDEENSIDLKPVNPSITWSDVTFTYGQNKVFDHFGLTITSGQRVGLVGPSGAGKTTFVSLLLRQHDLDDGAILIDNQDISQVTQDSLREAIAVVPQEPMLFHRTIRENIAYGKPDATDEEIIAVAKKAQAHDFIASLEDGYETLVGERGVKLSGGQKQRVAIARAMLKDAPILVLDEATSALDSESEVLIQKALHELMEGKTVIAVAHRLSTLREMDRILVLEGGQIIEDGNHTELSKAGGTYERLWEHQAGGFVA